MFFVSRVKRDYIGLFYCCDVDFNGFWVDEFGVVLVLRMLKSFCCDVLFSNFNVFEFLV